MKFELLYGENLPALRDLRTRAHILPQMLRLYVTLSPA